MESVAAYSKPQPRLPALPDAVLRKTPAQRIESLPRVSPAWKALASKAR